MKLETKDVMAFLFIFIIFFIGNSSHKLLISQGAVFAEITKKQVSGQRKLEKTVIKSCACRSDKLIPPEYILSHKLNWMVKSWLSLNICFLSMATQIYLEMFIFEHAVTSHRQLWNQGCQTDFHKGPLEHYGGPQRSNY